MTCHKTETDMHDALYLLVCGYPEIPGPDDKKIAGVNAVAQILGTPEKTFRKQLAREGAHRISWERVVSIMELCRKAGMKNWASPLEAFNHRLHHIALESADLHVVEDDCIYRAGNEFMSHAGGIAGSIGGALQDGRIDHREMDEIEKKGRWANKWLNAWLARCRAKFRKDATRKVPA